MSLIVQPATPSRLNRCQLFVPGSSPQFFEKAAASNADVVNLDLEDSVAPEQKPAARKKVIEALNDINWGDKTLSLRINSLDTQFWVHDLTAVLSATSRLDLVMIPKVGNAKDVYAVEAVIRAIEEQCGRNNPIGLEVIIESAAGLMHVEEIAASSRRMQAMSVGAADLAASLGMRTTGIGGTQENYYMLSPHGEQHWGDPWHTATAQIVAACRMHGLLPVDGPFGDYQDPDGFRAQALRSATMGMIGKWAIHPSQIDLANEVFTPSEAEVGKAKRILEAMEQAQKEGSGAVTLDGKLVDMASIKQAQVIVSQAELIANG